MKAGFYGGVVVDYPNSAKAKKFFLVLMTGGAAPLPNALGKTVTNAVLHESLLSLYFTQIIIFCKIKLPFILFFYVMVSRNAVARNCSNIY